ncbi:hypothetical protein HK104_005908 [Borealophlyctis nickersoniae]|nr:hypothetical protein HK104_005908 [Borealophlyctis nickersoniae]
MHKTSSQQISQSIVGLPTLLECLKDAVPKSKRKALKEQIKDPTTKKIKLSDVDIFPKMNLPTPPDLDVYQDEPLKLLKYLPNNVRYHEHQLSHNICCRIARWCKYVVISWDDFWAWNKQKDDSTKREEKYRRYWRTMNLVKYAVSSKLVATYLVNYVYDKNILKTHPIRQMIASYNTKFDHKAETRHFSIQDHIKAEGSKAVIMHVPLDGAKSHSSMKWLEKDIKENPDGMVLWLSCRIALTKDQCGRIEKLTDCDKWKYYDKLSWAQKEDPNREQEQYFVCSIQSIHRARGLYDVIVIDECETFLKSFDPENKCVPDMKRTWNLFQDQLNHANKSILLDGFITQITTGLLSEMGITPYTAGSACPPPLRKMLLCDTSCYIYDLIEKAFGRGEKIFIGTGAKGKSRPDREDSVEHIASTILKNHPKWKRGVEVLVFHGDTTQAKKSLERGAVSVMGNPKVRVVVGNAALSIGIDFSPTPEQLSSGDITQFNQVFSILQPSCISMPDFFQLLYRVRQPNNDTFIVYLAKPLSHGWKRNKGVKRELPDCNIYHNLVKRLEVELRSSNSLSYKQMFKKFCEWMNIEIIDGVETLTDEEKSAIEATFDYSQNMFAWSNIRDLNSAEYEIYREQLMTSSMDAEAFLQMEKFEFKKLVPPHAQEEKWDQEK